MREICIAGKGFSSYFSTFKNSILRRAPYRRSYILLFNQTDDGFIDTISIRRYFPITHFPITQLKICKVS